MPDENDEIEEIKRRNQKKMLAALVRTGKHVYGVPQRPKRRKNNGA